MAGQQGLSTRNEGDLHAFLLIERGNLPAIMAKAFEDAGVDPTAIEDRNIGVFVGIEHCDYGALGMTNGWNNADDGGEDGAAEPAFSPYSGTSWSTSIASNRIAYCLPAIEHLHAPAPAASASLSLSLSLSPASFRCCSMVLSTQC